MKRYVLTSVGIAAAAIVVVLALYFLGAFAAPASWLEEVYALRGIFEDAPVARVKWLEVVVVVFGSLGVAWCVVDVSQVSQKIFVFCAVSLIVFGISPTLALYNVLFEPFAPLTAVLLAAAGGFVFAGTEKGMRKRVLEGVLGIRVTHSTFDKLMEANEPPDFSGSVRDVTVLTCRLFNHEELRERLEPAELLKMSNLFLRSVSNFLMSRGAYLDESGPELVRVYFGMLEPSENHAEQACRAALELRSRLRNLSQECETRWFQKLGYGVGISSGPMTAGVYGSRQHFFFSGTGAETDYSRRLAHANRRYGSDLLIGPDTYTLVKESFEVRPMEMFYDPETDAMSEIYQLLAPADAFGEVDRARRDLFWQGVVFLREKRFEEALDHLSRARLSGAEDGPADFFIARAQEGVSAPGTGASAKSHKLTEEGHARLIRLM
ncbi:MAG: adenylate/guanylate cyclase domain-containing protein [Verrucomicrobiales bacterium]